MPVVAPAARLRTLTGARMRCPECGADSTVARVAVDAQNVARRERVCEGGRHRFHTSEVVDGTPIEWQPEGDTPV